MGATIEVKYFNSFWCKKIEGDVTTETSPYSNTEYTNPTWPSIPWNTKSAGTIVQGQPYGYPKFPLLADINSTKIDENWYIEESRIKGAFNETPVALGVRAYLNEEDPVQDIRESSIIYSGVYNSRTAINQTNVFSIAEPIVKSLDPAYGSIQKLFAEDSNLIVFQENKVSQALIDKDAIYAAEGSQTPVTTQNLVIGQAVPYLGRYGIGKNPESFAQFGFRKYFADPNRGLIMRLSRDGLTEISEYGMKDFFRDTLTIFSDKTSFAEIIFSYIVPLINAPTTIFQITNEGVVSGSNIGDVIYIGSKIKNLIGNSIVDTGSTVVEITKDNVTPVTYTVTVDKPITIPSGATPQGYFSYPYKNRIEGGWDNFNKLYTLSLQLTPQWLQKDGNAQTLSYDETVRGWNTFYSYKPSRMFSLKGKFYSFNSYDLWTHYEGENVNNYLSYYGQDFTASITFYANQNPSSSKVFQTLNYEGDAGWKAITQGSSQGNLQTSDGANDWANYGDQSSTIWSYAEGAYVDPITGYTRRAGFDLREGLYTGNINNTSFFQPGQVLQSSSTSGVKGFFMTVTLSTDGETNKGGGKELWAVGTTFVPLN